MLLLGVPFCLILLYNVCMSDILKTCLGFMGILLVGLLGVFISEMVRFGDTNALITTVDNITSVR